MELSYQSGEYPKLCWYHVNCWVAEHRHLCIQYMYAYLRMFIISALMWLHPQPSLLSCCRGCVWHSFCISLLYKAMECGTWRRYDEEHLQVHIRVCTCIENQSKHMYIYLYTPHHGGLGCPTILSNRDCIDFLRYLYKVESVVSKMYLHTVDNANIQGGS